MQRQIRLRTAIVTAALAAILGFGSSLPIGSIVLRADSPFRLTRWLGVSVALNSSTSFTINLASGIEHRVLMNGNVTAVTFSNPPTTGYLSTWTIKLTQDGTGSRTLTGWPGAVKWPGGVAPTLSTTAGKVDIVQCMTDDGGTTDFCVFNQAF